MVTGPIGYFPCICPFLGDGQLSIIELAEGKLVIYWIFL